MTFRFRESFRGYNRSDVNSYIEQINQKFNRREDELKKEIELLKSEKTSKSNSDVLALTLQLEALKTENCALKEENATLRTNPYEQEVIALRQENELLRAEKQSELDSSSKIGNILIAASENAEKIVESARGEAGKIIAEANVKAGTIIYDAEIEKKKIIDDFSEKVKEASESYLKECTEIIAENSSRLNVISDNIRTKLLP